MNLHEFQSKQVFREYGIPVPDGLTLSNPNDLDAAIDRFGQHGCIIKAQVHAGGRGKGGGVIKANNASEIQTAVTKLLGSTLITPQTDAHGLPVNTVLLEPLSDIQHEYYLGMLIDREQKRITIIASEAGGMSIEEVAETKPECIHTETIDPVVGFQAYQGRNLGYAMGMNGSQIRQFTALLLAMYRLFIQKDASLVEINPLAAVADGALLALDAKVNLDDSALYRQNSMAEYRDSSQEDKREAEAAEYDLNYIHLDGDIGCMVNGAGLAMATMDLIKLHGGEPANFLDVGGGTTTERVSAAFKLILSDPNIKAVLVNIFGGIVRCDLIAKGIIQAVESISVIVPVVVRLEGTRAEEGRQLLADSGLTLSAVNSLEDAAQKVVSAAQEGKL